MTTFMYDTARRITEVVGQQPEQPSPYAYDATPSLGPWPPPQGHLPFVYDTSLSYLRPVDPISGCVPNMTYDAAPREDEPLIVTLPPAAPPEK